jgi:hypothetical protein
MRVTSVASSTGRAPGPKAVNVMNGAAEDIQLEASDVIEALSGSDKP